jgi:hypothetical protein
MYNDIAERNARATKYIAEKEFKRQQVADARFEFLMFSILLTGLTCLVLAGKQILEMI